MAAFTNAAGEQYVTDIVWNGFDENLKPEVMDVLNQAQSLVDFPIVINSGYRSPARNKAAGGAKKSQHLTGNAVDISVKGLTSDQRTQLTRALAQAGASRLGVYSGNTAIHLDMAKGYGKPAGYSVYPMYDKSFANMGRAPRWFTSGLDGGLIPPGSMPAVGSAVDAINSVFPQTPSPGVAQQRMAYANSLNVPLPRPRPMPTAIPSAYDSPKTPAQVASLYEGIYPRRPSVDNRVGIAGQAVTPSFDGANLTDPRPALDWGMFKPGVSAGGLGSLLSGNLSPAAPNTRQAQTMIAGRPSAPIGSMPAAAKPNYAYVAGRPELPTMTPPRSVFSTGQGIAGTAQMPTGVRPNVPTIPYFPPPLSSPAFPSNAAALANARAEQAFQRGGRMALPMMSPPIPLTRPKTPVRTPLSALVPPIPLMRPASLSSRAVPVAIPAQTRTASVSSGGRTPGMSSAAAYEAKAEKARKGTGATESGVDWW